LRETSSLVKKIGYILLQVSGYLILLAGIADFAMTFYTNALPVQHLKYLKIKAESVSLELTALDHAFLRALGGCLVSIGIGTLALIYRGIRKKMKGSLVALLCMVTIGEGVNASQMFRLGSPYFVFPLLCVMVAWIGAGLWLFGKSEA